MSEKNSEKQPLISGPQVPSAPPLDPPPTYSTPGGGSGGATVYIQPQKQSTRTVVVNQKPPNYLVPSILTMILCCWIFGLVALLTGQKVDSAWQRGDADEARRYSQQAKKWNIVALVVGIISHVIAYILSGIIIGVALA